LALIVPWELVKVRRSDGCKRIKIHETTYTQGVLDQYIKKKKPREILASSRGFYVFVQE